MAILGAVWGTALLLAQAGGIEGLGPWLDAAATSVIAGVFIYLITRGIPQMQQKFDDALSMERRLFQELLKEERELFTTHMTAEQKLRQELNSAFQSTLLEMVKGSKLGGRGLFGDHGGREDSA